MTDSPSTARPTSRRLARPNLSAATAVAVALAATLTGACGQTIRPATDDAGVSTRVRTALLNDPQVAATGITVRSANGVVTLSGTVRSAADAERAIAVARQTMGVTGVQSELAITPP